MPLQLARTLIGMVHLLPLPGSPRWSGVMADVVVAALHDVRALVEGGMDALLLENYRNPVDPARVRRLVAAAHE